MTALELIQRKEPETSKPTTSALELIQRHTSPVKALDLIHKPVSAMDLINKDEEGSKETSVFKEAAKAVGRGVMTGLEVVAWPFEQASKGVRSSARMVAGQLAGETTQQTQQAIEQGWQEGRGIGDEMHDLIKQGLIHYGASEKGASAAAFLPGILADIGGTVGTIPGIAKAISLPYKATRAATKYGAKAVEASRFTIPGTQITEQVAKTTLAERMLARGEEVAKSTEAFVGRKLVPRYTQKTTLPESEAFIQKSEQLVRDSDQVFANAKSLSERLGKGLSRDQRVELAEAIQNNGVTQNPLLQARAQEARTLLDEVGQQAVSVGLLPQAVYEQNKGKYMARFYEAFENKDIAKDLVGEMFGRTRINVDRFMKRKNITQTTKDLLGEIRDPAYAVAKGVAQTQEATLTSRFFSEVARNPRWASTERMAPDWIRIDPEKKKGILTLGELSGKFVHPAIAEEINQTMQASSALGSWYKSTLSRWKKFKTVDNPMTHFGNIIGNTVLADLGGLSPARMDIYGRAAKDFATKGGSFQEAAQANLFGKEFAKSEFLSALQQTFAKPGQSMFDSLGKITEGIAKVAGKIDDGMAKAYQFEEQFYKYALFLHAKSTGMTTVNAVKHAEKFLFNYSDTTKFIKNVRDYAIPFVTFPYKAVPAVMEAALKNPFRVNKYIMTAKYLQDESLKQLNLNEKEWDQVKRSMEPYVRKGFYLPLFSRDAHGRIQHWDVSRFFLLGQLKDVVENPFQNPIWPLAVNVLAGRDWRMQPLYKPDAPAWEKAQKTFDALYKLILPSLAPPIPGLTEGGYSAAHAMRYVQQTDPRGEPPSGTQAVLRQVGSRIVPQHEKRSWESTQYEMKRERDDLMREEQRLRQRYDEQVRKGYPQMTKEERDHKIKEIRKKMLLLTQRGPLNK